MAFEFKDFEKIYVVNLKDRPDRLNHFNEVNKHILQGLTNITYFEAINGKTLDTKDWEFEAGALGCLLSHLQILKDAKASKYSTILILEDDAELDSHANTSLGILFNELPENWDFLYLYANHIKDPSPYSPNLIKINSALSTVAYIVHERSFDILIKLLERKNRQVDVVFAHLHFLLNAYASKVEICSHPDGYSDIQMKVTAYNQNNTSKIFAQTVKAKIKSLLKKQ